jgi:hypothetical protein
MYRENGKAYKGFHQNIGSRGFGKLKPRRRLIRVAGGGYNDWWEIYPHYRKAIRNLAKLYKDRGCCPMMVRVTYDTGDMICR